MEAQIRGLQAQVDSARDACDDTSLRAPFKGVVATRLVKNFEKVEAKQPIIWFQDLEYVEIIINVPENVMSQWYYCARAGVSRVLFYERLPVCLGELPFVTDDVLPEYPHALERGIRPPGSFFDHFDADDERVVWAYESETFEGFGYRRYDAGLPASSPDSLLTG